MTSTENQLREALQELVDSHIAHIPPCEAGMAAQEAWAVRRGKAMSQAVAALSQPTAASQADGEVVYQALLRQIGEQCYWSDVSKDMHDRWAKNGDVTVRKLHTTPPAPDHTEQIAQMAEIAGLESSIGHLSALVDDARSLLQRAMQVMKQLHESAQPDESQDGVPAVIPGAAFAKFVDAHAELMHAIANSPHANAPQPDEKKPLSREQVESIMTEHYPLSSLLREEVDAFELCVRHIERLHSIRP